LDSRQIHGSALARVGRLRGTAMYLYATDAQTALQRLHFHFLLRLDGAGSESSSDNGAKTLHRKGAVNRKAKRLARCPGRRSGSKAPNCLFQLLESRACFRANGEDRCAFQKRTRDELLRFELDEFDQIRFNGIRLRDDNYTLMDAEQAANIEVFARL